MILSFMAKHIFKIKGLPDYKEFNGMVLGRQIEHFRAIEKFKTSAKHNHFGQKHITFEKGLKEFKKLYDVDEFYCVNRNSDDWKDDSTEIWFTTK